MKQLLRRFVLNDGGPARDYDAKGFEGGRVAGDANPLGGPAFVGRLKGKRVGRFAFKPALRDWRTFGAFAVELYNGSEGCAWARVRLEDDAGAFYEEVLTLPRFEIRCEAEVEPVACQRRRDIARRSGGGRGASGEGVVGGPKGVRRICAI